MEAGPLYWPEMPVFKDRNALLLHARLSGSSVIPQEVIPFAIEVECTIIEGVICREIGNPGERVRDNYRQGDTFTLVGVDLNDPGFYVARARWQNVIEPVFLLSRHMKVSMEHTIVSDCEWNRLERAKQRLQA
jgi:hypothetical protein